MYAGPRDARSKRLMQMQAIDGLFVLWTPSSDVPRGIALKDRAEAIRRESGASLPNPDDTVDGVLLRATSEMITLADKIRAATPH